MQQMKIRGTDLLVNPVGLGTNAVGGQRLYPTIKNAAGRELLRTALDHGVNFWDTAFSYGPEKSEKIIGEVLKATGKRHDVVLATKAAQRFVDGKTVYDNSPTFLKQAVDDALTRLQTDYIDLFYIHYPDEATPKYEAIGALKELKDAGKIRAIGVSNFSKGQLADANRDGYVNVLQGEYNLFKLDAEQELFPYTIKNNISFVPFFPLASGLLTGKYDVHTSFPEGDFRNKMPQFQGEAFKKSLEKVETLKGLVEEKGVEVAHLVLAWCLQQDAIDVVIPGAKSGKQVIDNQRALDLTLTSEEIKVIHQTFGE